MYSQLGLFYKLKFTNLSLWMRVEITILPATIRSIILHVSSLLPENTSNKIYETIILRFVTCGWETCSFAFENRVSWGCWRMGFWGIYLVLRGSKWQKTVGNHILRNSTYCAPHQILLWLSNRGWVGLGMLYVWGEKKFVQGFGG